jgi:RimJ/RimL family protein N-acetyltransferase
VRAALRAARRCVIAVTEALLTFCKLVCVLTRLASGVPVAIRAISPEDKALLSEGLRQLSPESSRRRFLTLKTKFTADELRYLTEVDGSDHVAYVAVRGDQAQTLVGVGRWVRLAEDPQVAEVAITIGDELHGQGLGTLLGMLLADSARANGVERFVAPMHSDNAPAHRLFAKISERLESVTSHGVDELTARLAA